MKNLNMKTAIKRYNSIMETIGCEYNIIGIEFPEDTEEWNIVIWLRNVTMYYLATMRRDIVMLN